MSSATRTASRSGPILEMVIFAAPLVLTMPEDGMVLSLILAFLVVKIMLLIIVIQVSIIKSSGVK